MSQIQAYRAFTAVTEKGDAVATRAAAEERSAEINVVKLVSEGLPNKDAE